MTGRTFVGSKHATPIPLRRTSAQYYMRAVENPEPYQSFFRTLEQAMFAEREFGRAPDR